MWDNERSFYINYLNVAPTSELLGVFQIKVYLPKLYFTNFM